MAARPLHLATTNPGKWREFVALLEPEGWALQAPPAGWQVDEDGATLAANALKKARALSAYRSAVALADDSGLEVEALGGAPGVHSARWAGHAGPAPERDAANNAKLLAALADRRRPAERAARLVCTLALVGPTGEERLVTGHLSGHIAAAPRGEAGFGYDPLFVPEGEICTLAELGPGVKGALSHRRRALDALLRELATAVR